MGIACGCTRKNDSQSLESVIPASVDRGLLGPQQLCLLRSRKNERNSHWFNIDTSIPNRKHGECE